MTNTELVTAGRNLYEQIVTIPFSPDEMVAFGQAIFSKTPWGALTPTAKLAMFRLAAALVRPSSGPEHAAEPGSIPDAEIVDVTAEESPSSAEIIASNVEPIESTRAQDAVDPSLSASRKG